MDKLYTIQEVAAKLGLSDKTLRRWEEAGRFTPSRTLGNQRRYSIEDLQILDAIKHGTINAQSDLLTIAQAGNLCGVSPTTILRWENDGKIHPFITSGNTYYPRVKLVEKLAELKQSVPDPTETDLSEPVPDPIIEVVKPPPDQSQATPVAPARSQPPRIPLASSSSSQFTPFPPILTQALITLVLILTYHFFFNSPSVPISPQPSATPKAGAVQGVQTPDPKLELLEQKLQDHLAQEMLKDGKPTPVTTINLDNTSLIAGTASLKKGSDQITITSDQITATTPITATFTSDFSPAKKYWITTIPGSFTLHTDFPVGSDASFNYSFMSQTSTPAASATPSAVLR